MKKEVLEALAMPFNLKEREGLGGKRFKYVASGDIIERMNTVFHGNWNVELIDSNVIEEQLLVLVRVSVRDEETSNIFYHDGYASYPIFRFTSGQNKGKVIDIGNSYRSAMTKAIKTACSRWQVALFLEETTETIQSVSDMPDSTVMETPIHIPTDPTQAVPDIPIPAGPMPTQAVPDIPIATEPVPTQPASAPLVPDVPIPAGPINNPEKMERPQPWPDAPVHDAPVNEPVFTNNNVVAPDAGNFPSNVEVPPLTGAEVSESTETAEIITPVQKVAIESLMEVNKINFKDLFMKAIPGQETLPSIEEISYLDAVKLIQCGNHLRPVSNL